MKRVRLTRLGASLLAVGGLGLLVAGCSKGSNDASKAPSISTIGSSAISATSTRDVLGYVWTAQLGLNTSPNGAANDMATVGSVTVVALGPAGESADVIVASITTVTVADRTGGFLFEPTSLAVIGSSAYAGTTGTTAGAGDIYLRTQNIWNQVVDGDRPSVVVASLDGSAYGFAGGVGTPPVIHYLAVGATGWDRRDDLFPTQTVPTAAITHFNEMWIGGGPTTNEGEANLYRGTFTTGFQQVPLPLISRGVNVRQEVSALASASRGLIVAIKDTDATSGQPLGGTIWFLGFGRTTLLVTLNQEAPLCLAIHEGTIFAGTSSGRLLYRDPIGVFLEEPKVPINQGITSLLSKTSGVLIVGQRTVNGARLSARIGNSNQPTGGGGGGGGGTTSYLTTVKPLLQASCASCHATLTTPYPLSTNLTDDATDYAATIATVTTQDAAGSSLLTKASGDVSHAGGAPWPRGSTQYDAILQWINDNVPF
ncbi:MAG: hypothetical protein JKY65_13005 [Planctomycetes bacterium]|nr:hypothetical protein [Planctomycetota bacterium]